jgi:PAS domain S-box-containing protein
MFSFRPKAAERAARTASKDNAARDCWPRAAFDAAPVGLAVASLDGRWLHVNDACCQLLGYARAELAHYSLVDLTHPEDAAKELLLIRRVLSGEQRGYRIEKRTIDKRGEYRTFHISATLTAGNGREPDAFVYVVEPLEQPAESGQDAGRMAIAILDQLSDVAVIRCDTRGSITGWNKGAERILGYTRTEVTGKNRRILYRDADNWNDRPLGHLRAASDQGHYAMDDFRVSRDGSHVWLHSTILPYAPDGTVRGFVEVLSFRDGTNTIDVKPIVEKLRQEIESQKLTNEELRQQAEVRGEELRVLAAALRDEIERRTRAERVLDEQRDVRALDALDEPEATAPPTTTLELTHQPEWNASDQPLELLIDVGVNRRTGALIVTDGSWNHALFFAEGRLTCVASDDPADFFGERLVRSGVITEAHRTKALQLAQATDLAFGRCLVILGAMTDEVVSEALRGKLEDDIERLAGWRECSWSFVDREPPGRKLLQLSIDVYELRAVRNAIAAQKIRPLCAVEEPKTETFIATRSGVKFHRANCTTLRRTAEQVMVASADDAASRGLQPCGVCLKS